MSNYLENAQLWLSDIFDEATRKEVSLMIDSQSEALKESFYKDLEFGTGGMRGVMGPGTNRINRYTLGKATQGLANYLKSELGEDKDIKVAIAYDCRHNSKYFAGIVANVLSANGIYVYVFEDLRPTPELSFAVRHLNCDAGIVLTASHNPPEYNGYKVYWSDGGQIVPPHDVSIISEVNSLDYGDIKFEADQNLIEEIGSEVDEVFIDSCVKNADCGATNRGDVKIVFTSLHGTSIQSVPEALQRAGFNDVHIVEEQRHPDGDFPTVESPNPEEPAALKMATDLAESIGADIVIGTDPDCDRLGIAVRNRSGELILLNGNQTMSVMTDFLIRKWNKEGRLTGRQFVGSTIVSTDLVSKIASAFGVETKIGLTGFKWIAKMIRDSKGKQEFIGGGEESFGYMVGDFVRDKDAVSSTLLACEIAALSKSNGSTFYESLLELFVSHGYYKEHLISLVKKGIDGADQIAKMMVDLREDPLKTIDGSDVIYIFDYQESTMTDLKTGTQSPLDLPKSNVLIYETSDGTRVAARPSGTEPKIKFYFSVNAPMKAIEDELMVSKELDAKIARIIHQMQLD